MKKIVSTVLVCVLLVCSLFALVSCDNMLIGTYEADWGIVEVKYEFGPFGKVTCTVEPIYGEDSVYEGKYKIDGDEIEFTFENEDAEEYGGKCSFTTGEEGEDKYIKISGIKYIKVD